MTPTERLKDKHWNAKAKYILLLNDIFGSGGRHEATHFTGKEYSSEEARQVYEDLKVLIEHNKKKNLGYYKFMTGLVYYLILIPVLIKFNLIYWGTWFPMQNDPSELVVLYILIIAVEILLLYIPFVFDSIPQKLFNESENELDRLIEMRNELASVYHLF